MILSNPLSITQRENKNSGPNPYQAQMAGLLQSIMARDAAIAADNQRRADSSSGMLSQIGMQKLKEMFKKPGEPTEAQMNAPAIDPSPMESDVTAPMPMSSVIGMDEAGRMTPSVEQQPRMAFAAMLPKLSAAAKSAYPDNPNMQQVAMTQAILESGLNGNPSQLATQHNNYFGIKSSRNFPGTGGSVDYGTTEYIGGAPSKINQSFATNNSMDDSFRQHASLMNGAGRYSPVLQARTPGDAFTALQGAGYATDPNYASKLRSIYGRYVAPMYGGN